MAGSLTDFLAPDHSDEEFGEQFQLPLPPQPSAALVVPRKGKNKPPPAAPAAPGEGLPCAHEVPAAQDDPATFGGARWGIRDPVEEEPPTAQVAPAAPAAPATEVVPVTGLGGCLAAYIHLIVM